MVVTLAACGAPAPGVDAGPEVPLDAGSQTDAGLEPDAGLTPDAGTSADAGAPLDAGSADAGQPTDAGLTLAARAAAARTTALTHPLCDAIEPFYWEIGDVDGGLASGQRGLQFGADTDVAIASASKWVFGAYAVERNKAALAQLDVNALTMRAGYSSFTSCAGTSTVAQCQASGTNGVLTPANVGRFDYGGGHFQKYAVDLGLGAMDNAALEAEFATVLGVGSDLGFNSPQLAGGMHGSATSYARFLRKILSGELAIKQQDFGVNAACTQRSLACPGALGSPAPEAFHYSYGHWVEDDPTTGDGAFSSAGAFGFYPWIDATRTLYGVLSRRQLAPGAGADSVSCGRLIRKAFVTGVSP